ncbi:MAG: PAS domain S-box protein [Anaerolineae bacterium]|nr:PAS domain S-box protein [Anaerolineae bacterium]
MTITKKLENWLFEPNPEINQQEQRRQARFLSKLLAFLLVVVTGYLLVIRLFVPGQDQLHQSMSAVVTILVLLAAYGVSRTRWYETAVYVFAIGFGLIVVFTSQTPPKSFTLLVYFLIPVILATMVLSIKKTSIVAIIEFIFMLCLIFSLKTPLLFWQEITLLVTFYVTLAGIILLSMHHRNQLEQTRQAEILHQEARLQTYFDNASDWLIALDAHGLISSINDVACHELGYAMDELVGQSPTVFVSQENQPTLQALISEMFQGREIPYATIVVQTRNGRSIWLEVKGRKLFKNNEIVGTFHVARNITERIIAENAREKLNREIKLLYETGRQLGQKIDLKTIYNIIYDAIMAVVPFKTFIVSSYDRESQILTVEFVRQPDQEIETAQFPPLSIDDEKIGIQKNVILNGESLLFNDYFNEVTNTQYLHYWPTEGEEIPGKTINSVLVVPLKIENHVQGIIQIHDDKIKAFSPDNLYFLEALSPHIIAAMTNASLLQQSQNELVEKERAEIEARKRQAVAETLQAAIAILNSSLSLEDVLTQILIQLRHAIPYDSASIQQKEGDLLILKAARGFQNNTRLLGLSFGIDANLPNAKAVRTQLPLALDNVNESYPEFDDIALSYQAEKICSWLGVPLIAEGNVIGMITIDRNEERPFSQEEIALATTFANHAAMAMHNAALYRKLETHSDLLEKAVHMRTLELQRTTEQVQAILNNSPDAILFLNADHTIQKWNPAFLHLFEYEDDEVETLHFSQLVAEADQDKFKEAMETAVTTPTTQRIDLMTQSKNGRFIEVNAALAPIQENGILSGIICSLHDVSQFKEIERLKDAFVSNVSHELRTPITNLRLHHDLLTLNPIKQDVYLERLGREIDRLNLIIEDLLRISRLDQKRISPTLAEVNLINLVEQYLNDRQLSAQQRQITLSLSKEPTIPPVQGDARLLEQVIGILLTNAMHYTPPGGQIYLSPQFKQEKGQGWAGISIRDTGPGIPESEQSQIFTRFFRGLSAIESGEPGTGLGLAIAQEIMHLHQGYIELESSKPSHGSTFIIWLPY